MARAGIKEGIDVGNYLAKYFFVRTQGHREVISLD